MLKRVFTLSSLLSNKVFAATAGAGTTVITLSTQLNKPHILFYLSVPFWFVIVAMLIVIVFSSMLSAMTQKTKSINGKFQKFVISIAVGLFISFVFIPLFEHTADPARMILWAAVSSFVGNVVIIIIADVLQRVKTDDGFKDSLAKMLSTQLKNRAKGFSMFISGGGGNDDVSK